MTYLLKYFFQLVGSLDDYADKRTNNIFLVTKPFFGLIPLILIYNYFVKKWGPRFMEKHQPFNIDKYVILYNILQILSCLYVVIKSITVIPEISKCVDVDYSNSHTGIAQLNIWTVYYYLKISDLLDTVFFVLRKKYNQISFLHVYHHSGMIVLGWIGTRYYPGRITTYVPFINSIVHVIMYSYYLISILDKNKNRYIWIKKYITLLQMIQFLVFIVISSFVLRHGCGVSPPLVLTFFTQNFFMLFLFGDFYIKAYIVKSNSKKKQSIKVN